MNWGFLYDIARQGRVLHPEFLVGVTGAMLTDGSGEV